MDGQLLRDRLEPLLMLLLRCDEDDETKIAICYQKKDDEYHNKCVDMYDDDIWKWSRAIMVVMDCTRPSTN